MLIDEWYIMSARPERIFNLLIKKISFAKAADEIFFDFAFFEGFLVGEVVDEAYGLDWFIIIVVFIHQLVG